RLVRVARQGDLLIGSRIVTVFGWLALALSRLYVVLKNSNALLTSVKAEWKTFLFGSTSTVIRSRERAIFSAKLKAKIMSTPAPFLLMFNLRLRALFSLSSFLK
ncbi:hypothetical protein LH431_10080, partial [Laribacter hongkongensis]|uniref:hypothetical protein n=1 Tax=Laribacter hongkongensis TaxID=168471 RepID=UPI001EFEA605